MTAVAAVLFGWGLSPNGYGNDFYAAATLSATKNGKAFLFGSLDPGNFITVDEPPSAPRAMGPRGAGASCSVARGRIVARAGARQVAGRK